MACGGQKDVKCDRRRNITNDDDQGRYIKEQGIRLLRTKPRMEDLKIHLDIWIIGRSGAFLADSTQCLVGEARLTHSLCLSLSACRTSLSCFSFSASRLADAYCRLLDRASCCWLSIFFLKSSEDMGAQLARPLEKRILRSEARSSVPPLSKSCYRPHQRDKHLEGGTEKRSSRQNCVGIHSPLLPVAIRPRQNKSNSPSARTSKY
jgi:hypothetical protein